MRHGRRQPRHVRTHTAELVASCNGCKWETRALNGMGNAARHHDATGHSVTVDITRTVTYGDPHAPMPGQTSLEGLEDAA